MALAGADVTVLEAREAGGSFAASARRHARAALRVRPRRALHRDRAARPHAVARARAAARRDALRGDGHALVRRRGVAVPDRLGRDGRRSGPPRAPARAGRGRAPVPGVLGRRHRRRAARRGGRRAARAPRHARPRAPRARGGRGRSREGVAVRSIGDGVVELADGTSERADQVLVATGAWTSKLLDLPIGSTQQVNVYLRVHAAGLPVWVYDLDVYGLTDDGGAGLKVGGHAIGASTSIPTIPPRARRRRPRCAGSPRPRAAGCRACPGPARIEIAARRRRLLLRADGERGADHRSHRRAHWSSAPGSPGTASSSPPRSRPRPATSCSARRPRST